MSRENLPRLNVPLPEFLSADAYGYVHAKGSRIGLQTIVRGYNNGYSPEMLALEYPSVSLATVHKVIAFYLENREEADRYLAECDADMEELRATSPLGPSLEELRQRMVARKLIKQA